MKNNLKKRINTSVILLFLLFLIFKFDLFLIYCLIVLGVLSIIEFSNLTKKIFLRSFNINILNIFFSIYIFSFCLVFVFLSNFIVLKIILYISLLGCIASDIGGFIFGKIFKGPKITKISPNKTYSGSIGSIIFSSSLVSFLTSYFFDIWNFKIVLIGIIISIFCQCGDLLFSFLKRKAKIKDTGNFFPGHGGVLDRIDGIILGVPFGLIIFAFLN